MEKWVGKIAVVTGASCGIGAEICKSLVQNGMIVIGCARSKDRIEVRNPCWFFFYAAVHP